MPPLPIIQALWLGSALSSMERLSIASFMAHGHEFHLYVYDEVGNVPAGTVLHDADAIVPSSWRFADSRGTYASFADLFRYKLLLDRGGWWVDTDVVCLQPFAFDDDYVFGLEPDLTLGNAVLRVPAGSEAMQKAWAVCENLNRRDVPWGVVGPRLLDAVVRELDLQHKALPALVFFPFDWPAWEQSLAPNPPEVDASARSIHLWRSMWALAGRDRDGTYAPTCLYERLKRTYLG